MISPQTVRYVAELKHVREVTLIGSADFGFWSDCLKAEGLVPLRCADTAQRCGDAAQVWVVSAEMVYLGVRFTEVSFSVRTTLAGNDGTSGMRLLHAFNSSRIFAWCERTLFATPYAYGQCQISIQHPPTVRLDASGGSVLSAEMSPSARSPLRTGHESWEGPVFLPPRGKRGDSRLFFARLSGHTMVYPFSSGDQFAIDLSAGGEALQPLADSRFVPQEWVVRADATHGKSRTYRRKSIFVHDPAT